MEDNCSPMTYKIESEEVSKEAFEAFQANLIEKKLVSRKRMQHGGGVSTYTATHKDTNETYNIKDTTTVDPLQPISVRTKSAIWKEIK
jgi:hypothetical protein